MKFKVRILNAVLLALTLAGCTIGNGRICGPQTPAAYCDAEALKDLLHPKPYIDLWEKPGASSDQKMVDWLACGGSPKGRFTPGSQELQKWKTSDDDLSIISAYHRADDQFQRCLIGKGLVWRGRCDLPQSHTFPACGAP